MNPEKKKLLLERLITNFCRSVTLLKELEKSKCIDNLFKAIRSLRFIEFFGEGVFRDYMISCENGLRFRQFILSNEEHGIEVDLRIMTCMSNQSHNIDVVAKFSFPEV